MSGSFETVVLWWLFSKVRPWSNPRIGLQCSLRCDILCNIIFSLVTPCPPCIRPCWTVVWWWYWLLVMLCVWSGSCKQHIAGRRCDRCEVGFAGFPRCHQCSCDVKGVTTDVCHQQTAQCLCKVRYSITPSRWLIRNANTNNPPHRIYEYSVFQI